MVIHSLTKLCLKLETSHKSLCDRSISSIRFANRKIITATFLLLFLALTSHSMTYPLHIYDDPNLLPGSKRGIMQDSRGILWFWSGSGVMSYDGCRFRQYSISNGLSDNYVYTMREGPDGNIYIATFKGLNILHIADHSLSLYPLFQNEPVRDLFFTQEGIVIAHDEGVSLVRGMGEYRIPYREIDPERSTILVTHEMEYDSQRNVVWMAMEPRGLYSLEYSEFLELIEFENPELVNEYEAIGADRFYERHPEFVDNSEQWAISNPETRMSRYRQAIQHYSPEGQPDEWIVRDIFVASDGTIWVTQEYNLYKLINGDFQRANEQFHIDETIEVNFFFDEQLIFISNRSDFTIVSPEERITLSPGLEDVQSGNLTCCYQDRQGILWLGWENGHIAKLVSREIECYTAHEYPFLQSVETMIPCNDNCLLFAGTNGVVTFDGSRFRILLDAEDLPDDTWGYAVDKNENILILSSSAIHLYDRRSRRMRLLRGRMTAGENYHDATMGPDGTQWFIARDSVYSWNGATLRNTEDRFQHSTFLYAAPDTSLYVGTWNGPASLKDGHAWQWREEGYRYAEDFPARNWVDLIVYPDSLFSDAFAALSCVTHVDGSYWFGTFSAGVVRIQGDSIRVFDQRDGIPRARFNNACITPSGDIVVTSAQEVLRFSPEGDFRREFVGDLSPATEIYKYLEDEEERVFLATSHGLHVYDDSIHLIIDRDFGLPEDCVKDVLLLEDGSVVAMQENGFFRFTPDSLFTNSPPVLSPFLVSISMNNEPFPLSDHVRFPLGERAFRLDLALTDFVNEHHNRFKWRLNGFDPDDYWRSGNNYAVFENLPTGTYCLHVKGYDGFGRETSIVTPMRIQIPPYFYETAFFKAAMILLVIAGFFVIMRLREKKSEAQKILLQKMVDEKTAEALEHFERAKNAEIHAKQLKVANQLAATIAHEFNNPLAIIKGSADLLRLNLIKPDKIDDQYQKIIRQSNRMSELVDKLLHLKNIKEIDYAAGMKILDIHTPDEEDQEDDPSSEEIQE